MRYDPAVRETIGGTRMMDQSRTVNIAEPTRSLSIGMLHLPSKLHKILQQSAIFNVGQLLDTWNPKHAPYSDLSPRYLKSLREILSDFYRVSDVDGNVDWRAFWTSRDIEIVPVEYIDDSLGQRVFAELPQIVERILTLDSSDSRTWTIVHRRFGLNGSSTLTLEELGIVYGITRERVRQIEAQALNTLQNVLLRACFAGKKYHVHPSITGAIRKFSQCLDTIGDGGISETELILRIEEYLSINAESMLPTLHLVLSLHDFEAVTFHRPDLVPAWGRHLSSHAGELESIIKIIDTILVESAAPMSAVDLAIAINKALKKKGGVSLDKLRSYIRLCSSVEELADGLYRARFEHLIGRANQVERILLESGEPMHFSELARAINHKLIPYGKRILNERNLANQMSNDTRFVPIGKSGEWGLSSWSIDTGTIVELVKQVLIKENRPMTPDEIYDYVSSRRSVSRKSIEMYLQTIDVFARASRTHWGLADWSETQSATVWTPHQVAELVEGVFKMHRTKKLPYQTVKQAVMDATGLSPRQARGLLAVNPVIKTEKTSWSDERYAILQQGYEDELGKIRAGFKRRKRTLRQEAEDSIRSMLEDAPGQQMPLAMLVDQLVAKFKKTRNNYYGYIAGMGDIEKVSDPETKVVMCRFKRGAALPVVAQVDKIKDAAIKERVGRAMTFLNEADVDVAMFLLSKEFEATVKQYLELAQAKGKIHPPRGHWSLQIMIDLLDKEEIITDKATLLFLKQQRNDRAHGSMPSVTERQIMMAHADKTVGMYVDYISLLCDLACEL